MIPPNVSALLVTARDNARLAWGRTVCGHGLLRGLLRRDEVDERDEREASAEACGAWTKACEAADCESALAHLRRARTLAQEHREESKLETEAISVLLVSRRGGLSPRQIRAVKNRGDEDARFFMDDSDDFFTAEDVDWAETRWGRGGSGVEALGPDASPDMLAEGFLLYCLHLEVETKRAWRSL